MHLSIDFVASNPSSVEKLQIAHSASVVEVSEAPLFEYRNDEIGVFPDRCEGGLPRVGFGYVCSETAFEFSDELVLPISDFGSKFEQDVLVPPCFHALTPDVPSGDVREIVDRHGRAF